MVSNETEIMTFDNFYTRNFNCEENITVQKNNFLKNFLKIFE